MMQTRSSMTLSPNGKQYETQDMRKNTTKKTMNELLAEIRAQLDEKTEKQIPRIEKDYAEEKITSEQLEKEYERIIAEVLDIQKQIRLITEKTTLQDKRIDNLSIDLKIQKNDTKDKIKHTILQNKSRFLHDATPKAKKMTEDEVRPKVPSPPITTSLISPQTATAKAYVSTRTQQTLNVKKSTVILKTTQFNSLARGGFANLETGAQAELTWDKPYEFNSESGRENVEGDEQQTTPRFLEVTTNKGAVTLTAAEEAEYQPLRQLELDVKVLQPSPITNVPKVTTSAPLATSVVFNKKRQSSLSPSSQQRKGLTKRWSTAEQEPTDADTTPYSQYSVVYKIKSKNYGTTAQDIFHELSSGGDTENAILFIRDFVAMGGVISHTERGGDTPISDKQQQGDISMSEQRKNITLLSISSSNEYISRGLIDIGRVQYHIYNIMTGVKKLLPHYQIFLSVYNVLCPHKFQMAGMLA